MNEIYADEADVEWTCTTFAGVPLLVIQASGPVMSGMWLQADFKSLQIRYLFDMAKLPDLVPDTFVCFEGKHMDKPLLACDPDPMLRPLLEAAKNKTPWSLVLQYKVEKDEYTRVFMTEGEETRLITTVPRPGWICEIR